MSLSKGNLRNCSGTNIEKPGWIENFKEFHINYTFQLRKKCPYSEFFSSVFSRIRTEYGDLLNARKYGPEKLRI